jgi:cell division septation protein DedD
MDYNKIISVTGLPGLYELLSSKSDGALVRSLEDKSTKFVSNRVHNFSHLESIEVFTTNDNANLVEIFQAMAKDGGALPSEKDASAIKAYFQKVYPELDFERVYNSDMKKMVRWFSILKSNEVELKLSEIEEEPEEEAVVEEPAPAKKPAAKKAKEEAPKAEKEEEAKPAKKAAPKKKAEEAPAPKKKSK